MIILGLTGGSGCGKTEACVILKEFGAAIINADQVAREAVKAGSPGLHEILEEFGAEILTESGELNRRKLGDIVFSNPQQLEKLNKITHPHITKLILEQISANCGNWLLVLDAPVLFESGLEDICTYTAAVCASDDVRLARIMERDGLTREQAQARIGAQKSCQEYAKKVDFIIENNGGKDILRQQIIRLIKKLKGEKTNEA
jgi:dephospho-CoA kinase